MKAALLLLLPLAALANPLYWLNNTLWPAYGTAYNYQQHAISVPSSFDRTAMFWFQYFNKDYAGYLARSTELYQSASLPGLTDVIQARTYGFNSLRMARAHAADVFASTTCFSTQSALTAQLTNASLATMTINCNTTAAATRYQNWMSQYVSAINTHVVADMLTVRRGFTDAYYVEVEAPKMAIADLVCRSTYDVATHKFTTCTPASSDLRTDMRNTAAKEISCGGYARRAASGASPVQDFVLDCVVLDMDEVTTGADYLQAYAGAGTEVYLVGTHTTSSTRTLMFAVYIENLLNGATTTYPTVYFSDERNAIGTTVQSALMTAPNSANGAAYYDTALPITGFDGLGCYAYRFMWTDTNTMTDYWYPGGKSTPQGWLKTYGLGNCTMNYCPCLQLEGSCCQSDCYITPAGTMCNSTQWASSGGCASNTTCDGVSTTCAAPTPFPDGHYCGNGTPSSNPCAPDFTCQAGVCTPPSSTEGFLCGSPIVSQCQGNSTCHSNVCTPNYYANTTLCGNQTVNGDCRDSDHCNGAGACLSGIKNNGAFCAGNTTCGYFTCGAGDCVAHPQPSTWACTTDPVNHPEWASPANASQCYNQFHCSGTADVCVPNWKPSTSVCFIPDQATFPCYANFTCSGFDQNCMERFKANNSQSQTAVVCRPSADGIGCDPAEYCQYNDAFCPPDQPCTNCSLFHNSLACEAVPSAPAVGFPGCIWCNAFGGCLEDLAPVGSCNASTCGGMFTADPLANVAFDDVTRHCAATAEASGTSEVVALTASPRVEVMRSLCLVIDVTSMNMTSLPLGAASVQLQIVLYGGQFVGSGWVPSVLEHTSPVISVPIVDRGLYQVSYDFPLWNNATQAVQWAMSGFQFVGVRYVQQCPSFDVVALYDLSGATFVTVDHASLDRFNASASWANASDPEQLFYVTVDAGACGDLIVEYDEDCDNPAPDAFCFGCHCDPLIGAVPDPSTDGCMCAYALPTPDAHNFTAPPFIVNNSLEYNATANTVSVAIQLSQTSPYKRNSVAAQLVDGRTGANTSMPLLPEADPISATIPGQWTPCMWMGHKTWNLDTLIQNGHPYTFLVASETHYALEFAIQVHYCEQVTMYRAVMNPPNSTVQPRCINARLTFALYVPRTIVAYSQITVVDSSVIWAYIHRGFLVIPSDGVTLPHFTIELETQPRYEGAIIENDTFYSDPASYASPANHISYVSNVTLLSTKSRFQQWTYNVYFDLPMLCELSELDTYDLLFTLIALPELGGAGISPARERLSFKLTTSEDWCGPSVDVDLFARQRTFPLQSMVYTTAPTLTMYLRNSEIYVVVDIPNKHNMALVDMEVIEVDVFGSALVPAYIPVGYTGIQIFNASTALVDPAWNVQRFNCSYGAPLTVQACYSMHLPNEQLVEDNVLSIETVVELFFMSYRRAATPNVYSAKSRLFVRAAADKPLAAADTTVVYRVTPSVVAAMGVLGAVSVMSVATAFWVIRRRNAQASAL